MFAWISLNTARCPRKKFSRKPMVTGRMVTYKILRNIPSAFTLMLVSASQRTSSGVMIGASRVETVVMPTE